MKNNCELYRVEYGGLSKYFDNIVKAVEFYEKRKFLKVDVELWQYSQHFEPKINRYVAQQILLFYSDVKQ